MKKETDRVKRWREQQKAGGKASVTVLLSSEARQVLTEEKEKTGESYAVIIERALQSLKKHGYRSSTLKHVSKRRESLPKPVTSDYQTPVIPVTSNGNEGQPRILIDDLADYYYSSDEMLNEQAGIGQNGSYGLKADEGLFTRLMRSSTAPFGRKKKWFK